MGQSHQILTIYSSLSPYRVPIWVLLPDQFVEHKSITTMSMGDTLSKHADAIIEKGETTLDKGLELLEMYGIPKGILMPLQNVVVEGGGIEATGDICDEDRAMVDSERRWTVDGYGISPHNCRAQ